ncbi:hypothetical protein K466DRAFT_504045, partial [Polyporus arcularius HHB13444]
NRRGNHKWVNVGPSYGGGQTRVQNISQHYPENEQLLRDVLKSTPMSRLAGWIDATFKTIAPAMHERYRQVLCTVLENDEKVTPNFTHNVFAAATFNLGPKVSTIVHTDHLNYAPGWCAIVPLGDFNHRTGGQLVLWDLNLVIDFPAGSLIFIPSAILRHSNTPVGRSETRMSFTQFTAGGIFRWADCGCKSLKQLEEEGGSLHLDGAARWKADLEKYPTWEELIAQGLAARR